MAQTSYDDINSLDEVSFIAGNTYTFTFDAFDENGLPVDVTACTFSLKISYYGQPDYAVLTKSGALVIATINSFYFSLTSADTANLSGKFIMQPTIIDISGDKFIPAQGVLTIIPSIK